MKLRMQNNHTMFASYVSPLVMVSVRSPISCPHTEERLFSEEEEARASRFKEFQGN